MTYLYVHITYIQYYVNRFIYYIKSSHKTTITRMFTHACPTVLVAFSDK